MPELGAYCLVQNAVHRVKLVHVLLFTEIHNAEI